MLVTGQMVPGQTRPLYVCVENKGPVPWPWGWEQVPQIRISYHWRSGTGELVHFEGIRSPLTARLEPGATQIVPVWVAAPEVEGTYILEFDLVHEQVRWFDQPLELTVRVAPGRSSPRSEAIPVSAPAPR